MKKMPARPVRSSTKPNRFLDGAEHAGENQVHQKVKSKPLKKIVVSPAKEPVIRSSRSKSSKQVVSDGNNNHPPSKEKTQSSSKQSKSTISGVADKSKKKNMADAPDKQRSSEKVDKNKTHAKEKKSSQSSKSTSGAAGKSKHKNRVDVHGTGGNDGEFAKFLFKNKMLTQQNALAQPKAMKSTPANGKNFQSKIKLARWLLLLCLKAQISKVNLLSNSNKYQSKIKLAW